MSRCEQEHIFRVKFVKEKQVTHTNTRQEKRITREEEQV